MKKNFFKPTLFPFFLYLFKAMRINNNMVNRSKFWCDKCYTCKLSSDFTNTQKVYFSTHTTEKYIRHLASKKHKKAIAQEKNEDDIYCKFCDTYFTPEQYNIHKQRNKNMWPIADILKLKCNNFVLDGQRYTSYEEMRDARMKLTRKATVETKDDLPVNGWATISSDSVSEDSDDEYVEKYIFYDWCEDCLLPINNLKYNVDDLKLRGHKVCKCYNENDYDTDELCSTPVCVPPVNELTIKEIL